MGCWAQAACRKGKAIRERGRSTRGLCRIRFRQKCNETRTASVLPVRLRERGVSVAVAVYRPLCALDFRLPVAILKENALTGLGISANDAGTGLQ